MIPAGVLIGMYWRINRMYFGVVDESAVNTSYGRYNTTPRLLGDQSQNPTQNLGTFRTYFFSACTTQLGDGIASVATAVERKQLVSVFENRMFEHSYNRSCSVWRIRNTNRDVKTTVRLFRRNEIHRHNRDRGKYLVRVKNVYRGHSM